MVVMDSGDASKVRTSTVKINELAVACMGMLLFASIDYSATTWIRQPFWRQYVTKKRAEARHERPGELHRMIRHNDTGLHSPTYY